jgi:UBX domain-containing protein 7
MTRVFAAFRPLSVKRTQNPVAYSLENVITMSAANDELVSQFMAVTGSGDSDQAVSYLEMSGGHLETAVGLYLEHQHNLAPAEAYSNRDTPRSNHRNTNAGAGFDEVRAPDETQSMRLMDDSHVMMGGGAAAAMMHPDFALMQHLMDEQLTSSAFAASPVPARTGVSRSAVVDVRAPNLEGMSGSVRAAINVMEARAAARQADDYQYDYDSEDMGEYEDDGEAKAEDDDDEVQVLDGAPPARLSDMFAAPKHLMHTAGGFQGARTVAKDSKRWLLVNIQRDAEFASHALNRDVWRDELVENLVREGFIFWQQVSCTGIFKRNSHVFSHFWFPSLAF